MYDAPLTPFPYPVELGIVVILGAILGSFTTMLTARVPSGKVWASLKERSQCPLCGTILGAKDLIPLLSWTLSKGRCRHCKQPISKTYPLTETALVILCALTFLIQGLTIHSLMAMLTLPFLVGLFVIDIRSMILPNPLVFLVALMAIFDKTAMGTVGIMHGQSFMLAFEPMTVAIITAILLTLIALLVAKITQKITGRQALGMGDVKLFFAAGLWLNPEALPYFAIISGIIGVVSSLLWQYYKKAKRAEPFPFGPSIILALYILVLFESLYI